MAEWNGGARNAFADRPAIVAKKRQNLLICEASLTQTLGRWGMLSALSGADDLAGAWFWPVGHLRFLGVNVLASGTGFGLFMAVIDDLTASEPDQNGQVIITAPTVLVWRPDRRLYVTQHFGEVFALTVAFGDKRKGGNDPTVSFSVANAEALRTNEFVNVAIG